MIEWGHHPLSHIYQSGKRNLEKLRTPFTILPKHFVIPFVTLINTFVPNSSCQRSDLDPMAKARPVELLSMAIIVDYDCRNELIATLQTLHLLPTYLGSVAFYQVSLIGAIILGVHVFIWLGITGALWVVHPCWMGCGLWFV